MDQGMQLTWLIIGVVTAVAVVVAGSTRRAVPGPVPTEHVIAATLTAVLAWELGVNAFTSVGQIGLGSGVNSFWILGHLVVGVAGVASLALVLRRHAVGVPLAIGVCVMRLSSTAIGIVQLVRSVGLDGPPNGAGLLGYSVALAAPALLAIFLFVSPYVDGDVAWPASEEPADDDAPAAAIAPPS